jgi:hypothetical protein
MLELIFLSPLLLVLVGALTFRFAIRRKPLPAAGWIATAFLAMGAGVLPLKWGVWIPDFLGHTRTLADVQSLSGERIEVHQRWNFVDFYTTELMVTHPDGNTKSIVLDGDDDKTWSVPISLDETTRTATVVLSGNRTTEAAW